MKRIINWNVIITFFGFLLVANSMVLLESYAKNINNWIGPAWFILLIGIILSIGGLIKELFDDIKKENEKI